MRAVFDWQKSGFSLIRFSYPDGYSVATVEMPFSINIDHNYINVLFDNRLIASEFNVFLKFSDIEKAKEYADHILTMSGYKILPSHLMVLK